MGWLSFPIAGLGVCGVYLAFKYQFEWRKWSLAILLASEIIIAASVSVGIYAFVRH